MKGQISIHRGSNGKVYIRIVDVASGGEFVEVAMTPQAFGNAVTGLSYQDADIDVRGLQYVGMTRITESRVIDCPIDSFNRKKLEGWLTENAQEEGWILSARLGSQDSITRCPNGVTKLRYSVTKYVATDDCSLKA